MSGTDIRSLQEAVAAPRKPSEIDAALDAYRKASERYREARDRSERAKREVARADEQRLEAGHALQTARERLDKALDAEAADVGAGT